MKACDEPIAFETLVALWAAALPEDEASRVEEHLFGCDACSEKSDRLGALVRGLREVIPPVLSHAHRDRLHERGLRIVETRVDAGTNARARFAPEADLLVHALQADLSRAKRVDVELVTVSDGVTHLALEGVPFDAARGEILIACQRHYESMFAKDEDPIFRVHVFEGTERRTVGEYVVVHEWR